MNKKIILNKKKCIFMPIIISIAFAILYFIIYELTGVPIEENEQIIKGIFSILPIFVMVIVISTFWGIILMIKSNNKNQYCLSKKKTIILSIVIPIIIGAIFIIGFDLAPKNKSLNLDYVQMFMNAFNIFICVSTILVIILFWLIVLCSKEKIKNEK